MAWMYLEKAKQSGTQGQRGVACALDQRKDTYQVLWRREWSPSLSVISAAFMALGRSWETGRKQVTSQTVPTGGRDPSSRISTYLLVGEDEKESVSKLILVQHSAD